MAILLNMEFGSGYSEERDLKLHGFVSKLRVTDDFLYSMILLERSIFEIVHLLAAFKGFQISDQLGLC